MTENNKKTVSRRKLLGDMGKLAYVAPTLTFLSVVTNAQAQDCEPGTISCPPPPPNGSAAQGGAPLPPNKNPAPRAEQRNAKDRSSRSFKHPRYRGCISGVDRGHAGTGQMQASALPCTGVRSLEAL